MDYKPSFKFDVRLSLVNSREQYQYGEEPNLIISWLEENVGPKQKVTMWPCSGEHWKCWLAFDPNNNFELCWCQVEFDSSVDDSIISLFVLQWT